MRATLGRRNEGLFDEYGTEFIFTARRATTGDILMRHNVAAMDLDFTWKLKLRLSDQLGTSSPFDLRILQGTAELDDSQMLRTYVQSGLLEVEVVTQTQAIRKLEHCHAQVSSARIVMNEPLPCGCH